jgi:hypothetical protein
MNELAERYARLNESYGKKLYFHLGVNAGFFSEFNSMLLAVLYSLENGIQFVLYSADANFRTDKGWDDFFMPFCPETEDEFHHDNNFRWLKIYQPRRKLRILLRKRRRGIDLLTHDVWRKFKNERFAKRRFTIPELGIDGDLLSATRILHKIVWRYNERTQAAVEARKAGVDLPERYVGLHIRSGDKVIEHEVFAAAPYIEKAASLSPLRDAFVLTDDYGVIERLRVDYPEWRFYTTCAPTERGYFHEEYQKLDVWAKAEQLLNLFAAMDILAASEYFIGTFSSNPGMNLGMRMPEGRVHGVDYDSWKITW